MSEQRDIDVAVVGAGVAGLAAALGLAQQGLSVSLVGPRARMHARSESAPFDGRIYAVAPATVALLEQLSVWKRVDEARCTPVERMRVFGDRGDELTFDAYGATVERLATIVEESELLRVLDAACDFQPAITRVDTAFDSYAIEGDATRVRLGDGAVLAARLLIGADGAQSAVRAAAGLSASVTDYRQTAVVTNLACESAHLNTAWQWFTDDVQQVDVAVQDVGLGHRVLDGRGDAEILDRRPGQRAHPQAAADRDPHVRPLGQLRVRGSGLAGPVADQLHQQLVGPHVRAAGAGPVVDPEDGTDLVVGPAGGEEVGRRVAAGVGDQHRRPVVRLADLVGARRPG